LNLVLIFSSLLFFIIMNFLMYSILAFHCLMY
ncbi:hypothetical protein T4A_10338, partial [Trichinella pseudospiralis]